MEQRLPSGNALLIAAAVVVVLALAAAVVIGAMGILLSSAPRADGSGQQAGGLPQAFEYDLGEYKRVDPALIWYRQTAEIPLALKQARAVAAGPKDRIYVAGDKTIQVFEPAGSKAAEIALDDEPRALTVAGEQHAFPGRLYVAMKSRVEVFDPAGKPAATWDELGPKAILTSIAAADEDVLVADAGNRIVYRFDASGKLLGRIGAKDPARNIRGFVIPSPYFDVAISSDGLVRVANPGTHRIEGYTLDGHLEVSWGKQGVAIEGFCGCCNPAHFAILPDGRFVTAEKGIPRVKIYAYDGAFICVVAGPEILAPGQTIVEETRPDVRLPVIDVAADSQGRILVLDPAAAKLRVFELKAEKRLAVKN